VALRRIGHPDVIPLLRHYALYDEENGVRQEAEHTLRLWAPARDERGAAARAALRSIEEGRNTSDKG
jgi:hypothetical protein